MALWRALFENLCLQPGARLARALKAPLPLKLLLPVVGAERLQSTVTHTHTCAHTYMCTHVRALACTHTLALDFAHAQKGADLSAAGSSMSPR